MLSRVADSLYWMGRYVERVDGVLRVLKINYALSQDNVSDFSWKSALFMSSKDENHSIITENSREILKYIITDKKNPNSVFNMITLARENARGVQDHITKDLWQCLNDFYHVIRSEKLITKIKKEDPISILNDLKKFCLVYYGIVDVTMPRGEGNSFLTIGKMIERSIQTIDILNINFIKKDFDPSKTNTMFWKHLLLSISGYEVYLKTYSSAFNYQNVIDLIVLNTYFPRSLLYSINHLFVYFERLKDEKMTENYNKVEFKIGKLKSFITYTSTEDLNEKNLCSFLKHVRSELYDIETQLNYYYFAHS
ncbi:MAG: alpha-E domain-containing protein [Flavobacteriaceae bacterium]|jgi:uncharacterized alpha-E superfamily protein|nr:alpha-E domain-containing protein [Flavobacteriaceae bacterium]